MCVLSASKVSKAKILMTQEEQAKPAEGKEWKLLTTLPYMYREFRAYSRRRRCDSNDMLEAEREFDCGRFVTSERNGQDTTWPSFVSRDNKYLLEGAGSITNYEDGFIARVWVNQRSEQSKSTWRLCRRIPLLSHSTTAAGQLVDIAACAWFSTHVD